MRNALLKIMASAALLTAGAALAFAAAPVPRKSAEFTFTDPSGKQVSLSSYKGKVVAFAFMYTTCPHCQREAQMLTKLQRELGPRGFQALGAAFNFMPADTTATRAATTNKFIQDFGIGFPVGHASQESVQAYLGISVMDRYVVPQIAVIDKNGMVVKQSDPTLGSEELQTEATLRALIEKLLVSGAPVSKAATK